jgi:cytochrome c oxidase subunit IV
MKTIKHICMIAAVIIVGIIVIVVIALFERESVYQLFEGEGNG